MWLRRFTSFLLTHPWQTFGLTFLITFVPIIGIIGILIAALITLSKNITEGLLLTLAAILPYFISFYFSAPPDHTIPLVIWAAVGVAAISNGLTWVFAVMWRRHVSISLILQIAALVGVLVVSIVHLAYPHIVDWWASALQAYYAQAKSSMTGILSSPTGQAEARSEAINLTKEYATGLMAAAVLFNALIQLIIARWWQATIFNPGSLQRDLHHIRLSQMASVLFLASLILAYFGNVVVVDLMPIVYLLFGAAGLSLVHYFFARLQSPSSWLWLTIFYIIFIFSMPISLIVAALIAFFDIWFDLRKRLIKI